MSTPHSKNKVYYIIIAIIIVASLGYFASNRWALSAQGDPEARLYGSSGNEASVFSINELAELDLRAYSQQIEGYREKLDIVIAVDKSGSMGELISGTNITKLSRAKSFVRSFIDQIGLSDQVYLSLLSYSTGNDLVENHYQPLTHVNSNTVKQDYKDTLDTWTANGGSYLNTAAMWANTELTNNGREGATKYLILVTDGGEHGGGWVNRYEFDESWIANENSIVSDKSTLATSISNNIKYLSLYINPNGNTNNLSIPESPDPNQPGLWYGNGGLMRFMASKTNGVTQLEGMNNWNDDFTSVPSVDNRYFYLFYNENINHLYKYIEGSTGSYINTYVKLPQQINFESMISVTDKGGRSKSVSVTDMGSSLYKLESEDFVPFEYVCADQETECIKNADLRSDGHYWISNNYIDIKLSLKLNQIGSFDVLSNYTGCENGPLQQIGEDSKVDYIDPRDNSVYSTLYFSSMCIKVADSYPMVVKTSYNSDPGGDLASPTASRQSSFEAGDDVWTVLNVSGGGSGLTDWKIIDEVPGSVSGSLDFWYYQDGNLIKQGQVSVNDSKIIFRGIKGDNDSGYVGSLGSGKNYIKYRYKI